MTALLIHHNEVQNRGGKVWDLIHNCLSIDCCQELVKLFLSETAPTFYIHPWFEPLSL